MEGRHSERKGLAMIDRKTFGSRLKESIKAKNLGMVEAANRLGWDYPRLSEYCSGKHFVPMDKLYLMIETLDLDPRIIFPDLWSRSTN